MDNSYWNGVEENFTSEVLKKMLQDVEVRDRSTEELDAMTMIETLEAGYKLQVRH